VLQAPCFDCFSLDPFPLIQDGLSAPEVDIRRRDVFQALVIAPVVVVIDKGFDLVFQIPWQEIVFQ
jgi:hypothetical protein